MKWFTKLHPTFVIVMSQTPYLVIVGLHFLAQEHFVFAKEFQFIGCTYFIAWWLSRSEPTQLFRSSNQWMKMFDYIINDNPSALQCSSCMHATTVSIIEWWKIPNLNLSKFHEMREILEHALNMYQQLIHGHHLILWDEERFMTTNTYKYKFIFCVTTAIFYSLKKTPTIQCFFKKIRKKAFSVLWSNLD